MFLARAILLSHIVFTVTSASCCGEDKDQCQDDCTGIVCTSDSHCGDQCCIGDSYLFKGHCGACHKTKHCRYSGGFGRFCRKKCCGSDDMKCLKTCEGISCRNNGHCDGECCAGDVGSKTCLPCHKTPPPCTRNLDCPTSCCKFGSCERKEMCPTRGPTLYPPTETPCYWNINCDTNCCQHGKCVPQENCHFTPSQASPSKASPSKASPSKASDSLDSRTVIAIAIPIAGIMLLLILAVLFYFCLIRAHEGASSQTTNHPAPPTVDSGGVRQVTYHKVHGDAGNPSSVAL